MLQISILKRPQLLLKGLCAVTALLALVGLPAAVSADTSDVDDETCFACHDNLEGNLDNSAHALGLMVPSSGTKLACISCHTGAEEHIDDPSVDNIGNPATLGSGGTEQICVQCHRPHPGLGVVGVDPHAGQDLACTQCHSIHGTDQHSSTDDPSGLCGSCHVATVNRFASQSNHPLMDGSVDCTSCHTFLTSADVLAGHGPQANCITCHPDQAGPFLFEHEATSSFSTAGEGCISCHNPHGSVNDRLLVQPEDRLCGQCHGTPPTHRTAHGGQFADMNCMECHSAVHGSYDNLFLLDSQLGTKLAGDPEGCYCHDYR